MGASACMKRFVAYSLLCCLTTPAWAQCFNRGGCDPSTYEIRSQLSVSIPVVDQTSPSEAMRAMEDARRQLSSLSDRETESVKSIYGADTSLRAANTTSNLQENGSRGTTAFVSVSTTYAVKKSTK